MSPPICHRCRRAHFGHDWCTQETVDWSRPFEPGAVTVLTGNPSDDWRQPYRSMDESGSPESAGAVAWKWIEARAQEASRLYGAANCAIETFNVEGGGSVTVLIVQRRPIVMATIYRDAMNYSVLVRWAA